MKERPILMSAPMVRACLDGTKTQTRRAIKEQPQEMSTAGRSGDEWYWKSNKLDAGYCHTSRRSMERLMEPHSPYGQPGDRLWVRENFMDLQGTGIEHYDADRRRQRYAYMAESPAGSWSDEARKDYGLKWKPSIHMPRAACRIELEITGVRVERLQEISEADAKTEGCCEPACGPDYTLYKRWAYRQLWNEINGAGAWDANPWVWVVEFKTVKP